MELIFKELKSRYRVDILLIVNPHMVEALLRVGILTLLISRKVYWLVCEHNLEKAVRYTKIRWVIIFAEKKAHGLMDRVLAYAGLHPDMIGYFQVYLSQALDLNVNRQCLSDVRRV